MKNEKLEKAIGTLIQLNPFFASILLSMEIVERQDIDTFATDGEKIYYNLKFLETLRVSEITFILAHEVLHCVFQHMSRLDDRDKERWNIATDYVINELLSKESGVGTMPTIGLKDSNIFSQGNGTDIGVYKILPDKPKGNGQGQGNQKNGQGPLDELIQPTQDPAKIEENAAKMRVKIAQARNAAKMRGTLSSGIDRLVEDCLNSGTDWKQVLRNFLSANAKVDLSYARPKRRFLADDICLPSLTGEKLGPIVVAVDCSGSVSEKILGLFEKEIKTIVQDVSPEEIKIVYFDSEVLKIDSYTNENYLDLKLSPIGGGGTSFSPIFIETEKLENSPRAIVVLTDLQCDDFGPTPTTPVLWASTVKIKKSRKLPFGETTYIGEK